MSQIKQNLSDFDYSSYEGWAIRQLQSGKDLIGPEGVLQALISRLVTAALEGELSHHLAQEKSSGKSGNRRNGIQPKKLQTSLGEITITPSRDRQGSFEPQLVSKWDRKLHSGLDTQILNLYSQGNSVEDIRHYLSQMYGASLSTGQISAITDQVWEEVLKWKSRILSPFYVLVYLDGIYFKIRENGRVLTKAVYTIYGVNAHGERDILDIHIGQGEAEGAKEWGRLLEKIQDRGVEDVLFFAIDGLAGLKESIEAVFPQSIVQRCIVHMVRTSLKFVADKDYRAICKDLRAIYSADQEEQAILALEAFEKKWSLTYPQIAPKWRKNWGELTAFFGFNQPIRRLIYTTNAIEGLHRKMRKVTKNKAAFTNEKALLKILYLHLIHNPKIWNRKVFHWNQIAHGLIREFDQRFTKHYIDDTIFLE